MNTKLKDSACHAAVSELDQLKQSDKENLKSKNAAIATPSRFPIARGRSGFAISTQGPVKNPQQKNGKPTKT